jgi:hypothetical protein
LEKPIAEKIVVYPEAVTGVCGIHRERVVMGYRIYRAGAKRVPATGYVIPMYRIEERVVEPPEDLEVREGVPVEYVATYTGTAVGLAAAFEELAPILMGA